MTNDLHALIHASGINGAVVLVGHSLGGLFATYYADKYPSEVSGLVLVDPSFSTQFEYLFSPASKSALLADQEQFIAFLRNCEHLAQRGILSPASPQGCISLPRGIADFEREYLTSQVSRPSYYRAGISETENFYPLENWTSLDGSEAVKASHTFHDKPLIVFTAGIRPPYSKLSDADNKGYADHIRRGHQELASRSTRGEIVVVPGARHDIQVDDPKAVVAAIQKVISQR